MVWVWIYPGRDESTCVWECMTEIVCDLCSCKVQLILWSSRLRRALVLCCWPIWTVCCALASSMANSWNSGSSTPLPLLNSDLWHCSRRKIWIVNDLLYLWRISVSQCVCVCVVAQRLPQRWPWTRSLAPNAPVELIRGQHIRLWSYWSASRCKCVTVNAIWPFLKKERLPLRQISLND